MFLFYLSHYSSKISPSFKVGCLLFQFASNSSFPASNPSTFSLIFPSHPFSSPHTLALILLGPFLRLCFFFKVGQQRKKVKIGPSFSFGIAHCYYSGLHLLLSRCFFYHLYYKTPLTTFCKSLQLDGLTFVLVLILNNQPLHTPSQKKKKKLFCYPMILLGWFGV